MVLQASHTWRGRLSPAGIFRTTLVPQLGQKFIEASAGELKYARYDTSRRSQPAVGARRPAELRPVAV